jgi:ribosomal protein S18 acetylase RimI-like enzyme
VIAVNVVTLVDNLQQLVDEINHAAWDHANEMSEYDVAALAAYVARQDTLFVACHAVTDAGRTLLGVASSRVEMKPYGNERWLYVDEVDICTDQRRRGAGKAIMRRLLELAEEAGCTEVWLGAEADNQAAKALYQSLGPDDVTPVIGYTYKLMD